MFWVIEIRPLTDAGVWRICDRAFRSEAIAQAQCDEWNEPVPLMSGEKLQAYESRVRAAELVAV
jgi:hypothetical protein